MDSGEEVAGSLVAACDDDAKLLECGKEDVTRQVAVRVIIPGQATVRPGGITATLPAVERGTMTRSSELNVRRLHRGRLMWLFAGQEEFDRVAERIGPELAARAGSSKACRR